MERNLRRRHDGTLRAKKVALSKPHIYKDRGVWVCKIRGFWIKSLNMRTAYACFNSEYRKTQKLRFERGY